MSIFFFQLYHLVEKFFLSNNIMLLSFPLYGAKMSLYFLTDFPALSFIGLEGFLLKVLFIMWILLPKFTSYTMSYFIELTLEKKIIIITWSWDLGLIIYHKISKYIFCLYYYQPSPHHHHLFIYIQVVLNVIIVIFLEIISYI